MKHWLTSYTKCTKSVFFILWSTFFPQWGADYFKICCLLFRIPETTQTSNLSNSYFNSDTTVSAWDTAVTNTVKAKKPEKKKEKCHWWQVVTTLSWWLLSQVLLCCPQATSSAVPVLQVKPPSQHGQSLKCSHCLVCSSQNTLGRHKSCQY